MDSTVVWAGLTGAITALYGLSIKLFYDRLGDKDKALSDLKTDHKEELRKRDERIEKQDQKIETLSNVLGKNTDALTISAQSQTENTQIQRELLETLKQLTN